MENTNNKPLSNGMNGSSDVSNTNNTQEPLKNTTGFSSPTPTPSTNTPTSPDSGPTVSPTLSSATSAAPKYETTPAFMGMGSSSQHSSTPTPKESPSLASMSASPFTPRSATPQTPSYVPPVTPHVTHTPVPPPSSTTSFTPPPAPKYTSPSYTPAPTPIIVPKPTYPNDRYSSASTSTTNKMATKSSHGMLWLIIISTILFLALLGGAAYWYLKVYSPSLLTDDNATSTNPSAFPGAVKGAPRTVSTTTQPRQLPARQTPAFSQSDQEKVAAYIRANIGTLSPYKSSLGLTVTDITFDGPDRAIVSYGNSQNSYSAIAVSHIDTQGNVVVTSFTILEK